MSANKKSLLVNSEKISRAITDSLNNISGTTDIPMLLKEVVSLDEMVEYGKDECLKDSTELSIIEKLEE